MKQHALFLKVSVLLLILLLSVGILLACTPEDSTDDEGTVSDSESDTVQEELFRIVENGVANFIIVAPERATDGESEAFMELRSEIAAMTGVSLEFTDDWLRSGETHDSEAYEILIGQTNYTETQDILNDTSYGSYRIAAVGRKLVLTAWSEEAIVKGAETLIEILRGGLSGQDLIVDTATLSACELVDPSLDYIPVVPNLKIDHIYDANGASEAIYENASLEHFEAYVQKMENDGYTKYAENARGNVHSAIFTDEKDYTFNVFYEGGYEELCVVIEEYGENTLPPKEKSYKKVCDTQFAQLGTEYKYGNNTPQNGMCYIWRLEDGTFIILDGGFNYKLGASNLYKTLSEMAVDPDDIEIAAWIISHFHGDHSGALVKFVQNYMFDVKIDSLIFNLPTKEQSALSSMDWSGWNTISSLLVPYNPNLLVYKAHPGQIYHFANAEVEILYTLEMYAPEDLTYYNTCSLITDVKFGDFNMMMLGDCSEDTSANLCANYGEAIEAEVVQVAHHGYIGGTNMLYENIDPIYVFWPAGATWYATCESNVSEGSDTYRNTYFFRKNTRVEWVCAAKSSVVLLTVIKNTGFDDGCIYQNVDALLAGEGRDIQFQS